MKITFSWKSEGGSNSPNCGSSTLNSDGLNLLSCLLMDDGGIPYSQSLAWVKKGIEKVDAVLNGCDTLLNWDRESWGVQITLNGGKIYSLYDENYFDLVTLEQLRNALVAWEGFLQSGPNLEKKVHIEL